MPLTPVNFSSPGYDYSADLEAIQQRKALADALMRQAQDPLQTQMMGQVAIPISPVQGLAKLAQGWASGEQRKSANEELRKLAERSQGDFQKMLAKGIRQMQGTPGSSETIVDEMGADANAGGQGLAQINSPAVAPDPIGAMGTFATHPQGAMFMPIAQQAYNQQQLAEAFRKYMQPQPQGAPQGDGSGAPMPQGTQGVQAPQAGGLQTLPPGLVGLAMAPGGAALAKLASDREIEANKQGLDREKFRRSIYEWEHLSANQRAELAQKGIKNALDLAEAKDRGVDVSGITTPVSPAATSQPTAGRPANFPVESPAERGARMNLRRQTLQDELAQETAKPPSPERDQNIAALNRELANVATPPGMSQRGAREAAEAGAKTEATERAKLKVEQPQALLQVQSQHQDLDRLASAANELGKWDIRRASGALGSMPSFPGGQAAQAESLITSLKAQVSGMKLQQMRAASKTGGAVGQVTEKEWPRLENMIVALDPVKMGPALFKQKLSELVVEIGKAKASIQGAYDSQYGVSKGASDVSSLVEKYLGKPR